MGTALENTKKRRNYLKQREWSLLEVLCTVVGFSVGGGVAVTIMNEGMASQKFVGVAVGAIIGAAVGVKGGCALSEAFNKEGLEQLKKEINTCNKSLMHIEAASEELHNLISSYKQEICKLDKLTHQKCTKV